MPYKKIAVCGDVHGNHQDDFTIECFFKWLDDFKPDICIFLGDLWDFPQLRNGASEGDKAEPFNEDWLAGEQFLDKFFSYSKENHFLWGNHCVRIKRLLKSPNAILAAFAEDVCNDIDRLLKSLNSTSYDYDSRFGVLEIGDMRYVHGYMCGVNAAKQHAEVYGRSVCGHVHRADYFRMPTYDRQEAWTLPCMCDIDPSYASVRKAKLAHSQGWGYGFLDTETGHVTHHTIERDGDSFIVPKAHRVYKL